MKKTPFLLILGIVGLMVFTAYGGYEAWQRSVVQADLVLIEKSYKELNAKIIENENKKVTQAIAAKKTLQNLQTDIVEWSEVIKKIRRTVPKSEEKDLVEILSYGASSNKDISMSVKTVAGSEQPYIDVADFIKSFDESSDFARAFVSSISSGKDEEGEEILTFVFNVQYVPEEDQIQGLPVENQGLTEESISR